jgi:hypothetical protein
VILLGVMVVAIVAVLVLVGPGLVREMRQTLYCTGHAQESICS